MKIERLTTLAFSMYSNKGAYVLLLGSGISRSAHIPTGWEIESCLIEQLAAAEGDIIKEDAHQWFKQKYKTEASYSSVSSNVVANALPSVSNTQRSTLDIDATPSIVL